MFDQFLDLISQPPGSLVYHFIVLFAVEAALAMSIGQWMRDRDRSTARLAIGIVSIFTARALLLVAALLVWQGYLPRNVLLPPIERAVDTATILALAWVCVTMDDPQLLDRNFLPDVLAAVFSGMMIAGFIGTYYYWFFAASKGELFNGLWLDVIWGIFQTAFAIVGLVWMAIRSRYVFDPFLKGLILILMASAAVLHIVSPPLGDVASAMHIAQLIAMPMLAAVAYRHVIQKLLHWDEFEPSRELPMIPVAASVQAPVMAPTADRAAPVAPPSSRTPSEANLETVSRPQPTGQPPLLEVVEALGGLLKTLDQGLIVREASRTVAMALRADISMLVVVDEEAQEAAVLGGYDNISQTFLPQAVLGLGTHTTIVNTLGRLRQLRMTTQRNMRELRDLYENVGITHQGPAYVQPLVEGDDRIGVLIVGSPYSERQLSADERNLLDRLAPLVASALLNSERYQKAREEGERAALEEGERLASISDELTAANAELNSAQRQMDEMKAYIRDMHRQMEGSREEIDSLRAISSEAETLRRELENLKANPPAAEADEGALRQAEAEIQRLREDNERLLQRVLQQKHESEQLRLQQAQAQPLDVRRDMTPGYELPAITANLQRELEETRLALQTELVSMRARMMQTSISQQEVAFLQEQLSTKARDAISLQSRLVEAEAVINALREQVNNGLKGSKGLESIQQRVADQATQIAELTDQLAVARSATPSPEILKKQLEVERKDTEATRQLETQLIERIALIGSLQAQLTERNKAIGELRTYMGDVERSLRTLEAQLSHKTVEVAELQQSLAQARSQAEGRIAQIDAQVASGTVTSSDADRAQVQVLQAQLDEKSTAINVLEGQLKAAARSIAEMEQRMSETHEAVDAAISDVHQSDSHDEVIASIAQELRTPMSSIMGYTELLLRESVGILGSLQRKFLQRVKANTERMGVLLEDLIRITALDTGRLQLGSEKVDIIYAIEETIMNVASQYREKGLTLRMTLGEEMPPLTADRDALLQIVGHLLSNAALASPVQGEVQILVTSRQDALFDADGEAVEADCLYVGVEDSGQGVAEEDYDRVFARKYRADNPLIDGLGDTGVSLSLAKALIDAQHGRIWLDSTKGKGTTFHVLLPLKPLANGREGE